MKQGDIYWCLFPGGERRRPAVLLNRNGSIPHLSMITVAPITRSMRGIRSHVRLGPDDGLAADCEAKLDTLHSLAKERIERYVGHLSAAKLQEVAQALSYAFALESLSLGED